MPPICGHRDELHRRCGLLQGHYGFANEHGGATEHSYVDTPESLAARGGAAASDRAVHEQTENELLLLDDVHRVAMVDRKIVNAECRICHGTRHDDACFLYRQQLEKRLLRTARLQREQYELLRRAQQRVADRGGIEELQLIAERRKRHSEDLEQVLTERNRELKTARREVASLEQSVADLKANLSSARARVTDLDQFSRVELLHELLKRAEEDDE